MKTEKRRWSFWGENFLETLGLAAAGALVIGLVQAGKGVFTGNAVEWILLILQLYPYYLFLAGIFVLMMEIVGYFQMMISVMISMSATRKSVIWELLLNLAAVILAYILISALIWKLIPGDVSDGGLQLLPLLGGGTLILSALFLLFGGVAVRWGKAGKVIFVILSLISGALIGVTFALNPDVGELVQKLSGNSFGWIMGLGVIMYLASGFFVRKMTARMEVRV